MIENKFLKAHALFGGLMDNELSKIKEFLCEEHFNKEENIIKEGETGNKLYLIYKGSVEILKNVHCPNKNTHEKIAILNEGDAFGEMELIDIQNRAATVKTIEKTIVYSLSNSNLYKIKKWNIQTYTIIIMNLARELSRRLRKLDKVIAGFLFSAHKLKEKK